MPSPNADWGYDVSDYCDVDPELGDLETLEKLVAEARLHGIRILLDIVPNHTSDRHPWFADSRSSRIAEHRDWYVWADGRAGGPSNNWPSVFGGPAWSLDDRTGQYYLNRGGRYAEFFPEVLKLSEGRYHCDYAYHLAPIAGSHIGEMEALAVRLALLPKDVMDDRNAIMTVQAGAGGDGQPGHGPAERCDRPGDGAPAIRVERAHGAAVAVGQGGGRPPPNPRTRREQNTTSTDTDGPSTTEVPAGVWKGAPADFKADSRCTNRPLPRVSRPDGDRGSWARPDPSLWLL